MRIRVKFSKTGSMRFLGHLDLMHFFQQLIRRSGIPIAYSSGMSPHQVMSFALPLGLGAESLGEYMDIEITEPVPSGEAVRLLNENSVQGIRILSFKELPEGAKNAMASVAAADYRVSLKEEYSASFSLTEGMDLLMERERITILKKTKKSEKEIDLKPLIYGYVPKGSSMILKLSCGSTDNIKPQLCMQALFEANEREYSDRMTAVTRLDLYTQTDGRFVSLNEIGLEIG